MRQLADERRMRGRDMKGDEKIGGIFALRQIRPQGLIEKGLYSPGSSSFAHAHRIR
jgi:hypothetical protein